MTSRIVAGLLVLFVAGAPRAASWHGPRPAKPRFNVRRERPVTLGVFPVRPQATFYLILDAPYARGRVLATKKNSVMLRVHDADERLTHWQYIYDDMDAPIYHPRDDYVAKLRPLRVRGFKGKALLDGSFALVGKGIHEVRIHGTSIQASAALAISRKVDYGVNFQNGDLVPWPGMPKKLYVYVPPRAEKLHIALRRGRGIVRVRDERGRIIHDSANPKHKGQPIQVRRTGVVWTFEFQEKAGLMMQTYGFPVIFCPTLKGAKRIKASVEVLPDGTVVAHKFQRRIAMLLPKILSPKNVGRAEDLIKPLPADRKLWLPEARRNRYLFGKYSYLEGVPMALRSQNVDPKSHWSGCFTGTTPPKGVSAKNHRWDNYLKVRGIAGGSDPAASAASHLAKAALLDQLFNPYRGKKELLYRAAAASLRDLMKLTESDLFPCAMKHWYPLMCFTMGSRMAPTYRLAAPHMPKEIKELWTEGFRRLTDRCYTDHFVSCRNQSAHQLVANSDYAIGSGDAVYDKLTRIWAKRFAASAHPTGWFPESTGPCGSYNGMTHWNMGLYYRQSGDETFLPAIRKSYRFFNHTVAPEPEGNMLGGYNFNQRVGMGAFEEQYSGAKGLVDATAPEVALYRAPEPEDPAAANAKACDEILKWIRAKRFDGQFTMHITDSRYDWWPEKVDRTGVWPAMEEEPFIRKFGGELVAVKRPAYYCAVYVGKPVAEYYIRKRKKWQKPLANDVEEKGGHGPAKPANPFLGGGLSLFWTPGYGTSLMATNWSPYTHHGLIAIKPDGQRFWEEYHATRFKLDEKKGELTISGRIETTPVAYTRTYRFKDDALEVELKLTPTANVRLKRLIENVPLVMGKAKKRGADITPKGDKDGRVEADVFEVRDKRGAGVVLVFDKKQKARIWRKPYKAAYDKYRIHRIEVDLPTALRKGRSIVLSYTMRPVTAK